jgi:hypothetical protein
MSNDEYQHQQFWNNKINKKNMINGNILELASNLAHNRTFYESGDICSNEDDMYEDTSDKTCMFYKDEIQDRFNEWYSYYLIEISKIFQEHDSIIYTLIKSCEEALNGTWDCTTEEGKESFKPMIELLKKLKYEE